MLLVYVYVWSKVVHVQLCEFLYMSHTCVFTFSMHNIFSDSVLLLVYMYILTFVCTQACTLDMMLSLLPSTRPIWRD